MGGGGGQERRGVDATFAMRVATREVLDVKRLLALFWKRLQIGSMSGGVTHTHGQDASLQELRAQKSFFFFFAAAAAFVCGRQVTRHRPESVPLRGCAVAWLLAVVVSLRRACVGCDG